MLSGLVYALLRGLDPERRGGPALAGALLIFVMAWVGFWARRRRFTVDGVGALDEETKRVFGRRNRRWHNAGTVLVPLVQAVVIGIGLHQVAGRRSGRGCSGAVCVGLALVAW